MVSHGSLDDSAQPPAGGHKRLLDFPGGGGLGEHPNVRRHSSLCGAPLHNAYGPLAGTCPMSCVNEAMMLVESITLLAGHTAPMARQLADRASHRGREQEPSGMAPDTAANRGPTCPPTRPVRGRPWKADGYTDRATGLDAVRHTFRGYRNTSTRSDTL
jgi:hypothetical protein